MKFTLVSVLIGGVLFLASCTKTPQEAPAAPQKSLSDAQITLLFNFLGQIEAANLNGTSAFFQATDGSWAANPDATWFEENYFSAPTPTADRCNAVASFWYVFRPNKAGMSLTGCVGVSPNVGTCQTISAAAIANYTTNPVFMCAGCADFNYSLWSSTSASCKVTVWRQNVSGGAPFVAHNNIVPSLGAYVYPNYCY